MSVIIITTTLWTLTAILTPTLLYYPIFECNQLSRSELLLLPPAPVKYVSTYFTVRSNCLMSCVCFRGCLSLACLSPRRRSHSRIQKIRSPCSQHQKKKPDSRHAGIPNSHRELTAYGSLWWSSRVTSLPCILLHHIHASAKDGANFLLFIRSLYQSHHGG